MTLLGLLPYTKSIIKKYGMGYYRATLLFPRSIRWATWTYYTFVRLPDEMVDTDQDEGEALALWTDTWERVLGGETKDVRPELLAFKEVMDQYKIPAQYSRDFLHTMRQDLTKTRYQTRAELETYMYGSAVVVGYTMSHIIGYREGALPHAKALGEAFQMTNFLRDIADDYILRGRIYLPQEDLERFGVTEEYFAKGIVDDRWIKLMQYEIEYTRSLYDYGVAGIPLLHKDGRKAVYAAALIYKEIIDGIEKKHYDIFSGRVVVSPIRKSMLLLQALWSKKL